MGERTEMKQINVMPAVMDQILKLKDRLNAPSESHVIAFLLTNYHHTVEEQYEEKTLHFKELAAKMNEFSVTEVHYRKTKMNLVSGEILEDRYF
jgi:ribosome-binding protein aMBF1 (putative translation factor)